MYICYGFSINQNNQRKYWKNLPNSQECLLYANGGFSYTSCWWDMLDYVTGLNGNYGKMFTLVLKKIDSTNYSFQCFFLV